MLAALSPLIVLAIYVEDWSRDLTTNVAVTSQAAEDPSLRPPLVRANAEEIETALEEFCRSRPAWRAGDGRPVPEDSPFASLDDGVAVHHLVRATGVMRFRDDVWVVAEDAGEGRLRIHAESRSRVGKGDLGQNPRNLRELTGSLRHRLAEEG